MDTELYLLNPLVLLILKATVLLVAATVAGLFLQKRSAALRHLVWVGCAAGLLALPVFSVVAPPWTVTLPAQALPGDPAPSIPSVGDFQPAVSVGTLPYTRGSASGIGDAEAVAGAPSLDETGGSAAVFARDFPWIWFWAGGAVFFLLIRLTGDVRISRIRRRCRRVEGVESANRLREALLKTARILGLGERPGLFVSSGSTLPFAAGIWRPFIVVPESARSWTDEKLQSVLLHELAHVERRDCLTQLVGHVARAFFWFHPLAWWMTYRMRVEREQACDDRVLDAGHSPSGYARVLLDLVKEADASGNVSYGALAMARRSTFEGRLVALLDNRRERRGLNRRMVAGILGMAACATLPLAMVQTAIAESGGGEAASEESEPDAGEGDVGLVDLVFSLESVDAETGATNVLAAPRIITAPGSSARVSVDSVRVGRAEESVSRFEVQVLPEMVDDKVLLTGEVSFHQPISMSIPDYVEGVRHSRTSLNLILDPGDKTPVTGIASRFNRTLTGREVDSGEDELRLYVTATPVTGEEVAAELRELWEREVARAEEDLARLRALVEAGVANPRETHDAEIALLEARIRLAEIEDDESELRQLEGLYARQLVQLAEERLEQVRAWHERGSAESSDVADAEIALMEARVSLARIESDDTEVVRLERRLAERRLGLAENRLARTQALHEAGRATDWDEAEAELELIEARANLVRLENDADELRRLAQRRVEIMEQRLESLRRMQQIGRATASEVIDAEIALLEARIRLEKAIVDAND